MPNRVQLTIAGFNLVVTTDEDGDRVESLARAIEKDILAIMDGSVRASSGKAAVVCALDYYDKLQKASESSVNLRNQIRDYLADAANAKLIIDEREKTIAKLTRELAESTPAERAQELLSQIAAEKEKNALLYRELDSVTEQLNRASEQLREREDNELPAALERIAELEKELRAAREDPREGDDSELSELRDDLADITEEARQLRDQNALLQSQKEALLSRAQQAEEQAEALRSQLETLEKMIEEDGLVAREPWDPAQGNEYQSDLYIGSRQGASEGGEYAGEQAPYGETAAEPVETGGDYPTGDIPQSDPAEQEPLGEAYAEAGSDRAEYPQRQTFGGSEAPSAVYDGEPEQDPEDEFFPPVDVELGFGAAEPAPAERIPPERTDITPDIVETLDEKPPLYGLVFPEDDMPDLNWTDEVLGTDEGDL